MRGLGGPPCWRRCRTPAGLGDQGHAPPGLFADALGDLAAIALGHAQVEQRNLGALRLGLLKGLLAVERDQQVETIHREQHLHRLGNLARVIGHQHPQARSRPVDALPCWRPALRALTSPPWPWRQRLQLLHRPLRHRHRIHRRGRADRRDLPARQPWRLGLAARPSGPMGRLGPAQRAVHFSPPLS